MAIFIKSFSFQTMTNENMTVDWLHLPSIPFEVIMTKVAQESLTDLRSCTEVCSAWSEMIEGDILKNRAVIDIVRDQTERAFGPDLGVFRCNFSVTRMLPTSEQISNSKWFSK